MREAAALTIPKNEVELKLLFLSPLGSFHKDGDEREMIAGTITSRESSGRRLVHH